VWTTDEEMREATDPTVAYETTDGAHALIWLEKEDSLNNDSEEWRRRLVRFAAFRRGRPPRTTGEISFATSKDDSLMIVWIDRKPTGRWALIEAPKSKSSLPFAKSFLLEVMKESNAADDISRALESRWKFDCSILNTKQFGKFELPSQWFQYFEMFGSPPQNWENSIVLRDHTGVLDFSETTAERLKKLGSLKYRGFEVPNTKDGVTRIVSKREPTNVAFIVRKHEQVLVLIAGAEPDAHFLEESSKLAQVFNSMLKK
jgi:hypothetical protein